MMKWLVVLLAVGVGLSAQSEIAREIQDWEVQTGQLPRDPNEKAVETPDDMTLFLLIGQSNMAGRAKVPDEDRQPLPRAYKLNRDDVWVPATAPFHFDRKSAGMGPANEFVKRYLADHPNETVGIVPCAVGGSQSATWDAHGEGKIGANFRRALARAKAAKGKGRFAAILWHQGESDAGAPVEELKRYYPKRFAAMIAAFRREIGDVPVVAGEIGWFMTDEAAKVNPVLNGLPDVVPNCRCVTSKGLKNQDKWHFDLPSAKALGQRYYAAFCDLRNPVRLVSVTSTADGTPQPAWFWTPQTAEKKPLLVELHSWSYGCTTDGKPHAKLQDRCRKAGWAFVLPNFRGPNETPSACGSDLAVQDVMDAVAYAKAHAAIDEGRIYLVGASGGGMMTLLMAGRHPDVWAACYSACPISDIARWHAETATFADWRKKYAGMMEKCCGGTPDAKPEEYAHRSPLTHLAAARKRGTVIDICEGIHDGHTGSVPIGHAIRAFNALADEKDRISEADIATFERTEKTPAALAGEWRDPFFSDKLRIHFRRTSANVRLTIFEGGHAGNMSAGFEWLGRQRRGTPADWSVAARGVGTEDVSTK